MIKVILLVVTISVATAQYKRLIGSPAYYGYAPKRPAYLYGAYTDEKPVSEYYEKPQPYSFGYTIDDGYGNNNYRNEEGDDYGSKKGSYGYTDAYGIYRTVEYVADGHGFRATIKTNEPGVGDSDPADVKLIAKDAGGHGAPYKSPSYGAPIYSPVPKAYPSYARPAYQPHYKPYY